MVSAAKSQCLMLHELNCVNANQTPESANESIKGRLESISGKPQWNDGSSPFRYADRQCAAL